MNATSIISIWGAISELPSKIWI